jgi:hypothetical protein
VEKFKYFGKSSANKNCLLQEDKEQLKFGESLPPFLPDSFMRHFSLPFGPV